MTCPYCGIEMEQGYIKSAQRVFWSKDRDTGIESDIILLSEGYWKGIFNGFSVESYYCPQCKKIITSLA